VGDHVRAEILRQYGYALARAGHHRAAAHLWSVADEIDHDARLTVPIASVLLDGGDPEAARAHLDAHAETHGWTPESRYLMARAAATAGDDETAIAFARELTADPAHRVDANLLLVPLLLDAGSIDAARIAADAVIDERPDWVPGLMARAHVAAREHATEEELEFIERARALAPDDPVVRTVYGVALLDRGSRAEGQRELAGVLGRQPGHPFAAHELIGSPLRSPRARRWLRAVFIGVPLLLVLIALAVEAFTGSSVPIGSVYVYSLVVIVLTVRAIERARTDSSVRVIKREAKRALARRGPTLPTLRPLRWLLLASFGGLWCLLFAAGAAFTTGSIGERLVDLPVSLTGGLVAAGAVRVWKRRRRQLARGEPRRFDPSACHCHRITSLGEGRATAYGRRHLTFDSVIGPGIERYRCPLVGVLWLRFSGEGRLPSEVDPMLLRLPVDFAAPMERGRSEEPGGFYL
jgi:Tfp pilus assembly protein PilF